MKAENQRIAIAEARGIGPYEIYDTEGPDLYGSDMGRVGRTYIPPIDLITMHEAEKVVLNTNRLMQRYLNVLKDVCRCILHGDVDDWGDSAGGHHGP